MGRRGQPPSFDYTSIPLGYYDRIMREGHPIRRLWHVQKFERIVDCLPETKNQSILDIGCFSGTFLSLLDAQRFSRQIGTDILSKQIDYAKREHGTPYRRFLCVDSLDQLASRLAGEAPFDCVTLIEVIEHLSATEIGTVLEQIAGLLRRGGRLVISTPNYASAWPVIELLLNRFSEVSYEEQHLTRFSAFNLFRKMEMICPNFPTWFEPEFRTTTHFVTPFLALLSYDGAHGISRRVPHRHWKFPFGNLVVASLRRK